jgi:hypothetical protein
MEIKKTIKYEIKSNLEALKQLNLWIDVAVCVAIVAAIFKNYTIVLILMVIIIFLKFKLDYKSGEVINYYRDERNIPNSTDIKRMKDEARKKEKVA